MLDVGALLLVFYAYSSWLCAFFGAYFIRGNNYFGANIYTFCVSAVRWLQRHRATPHNCVAVFLVESHWTGVISQSREYIYPQQQQHQGIEHWRRRRRLGCHRSQAGLMKRQSYRVVANYFIHLIGICNVAAGKHNFLNLYLLTKTLKMHIFG